MKRDSDGLLLANFNQTLPEWQEPFVFPSQVEQAFFLDVEDSAGWRLVCHKQARSRRVEGSMLEFSLEDHKAFEHPRVLFANDTRAGTNYIPLTRVEQWEGDGEMPFVEVEDET